MDVNISSVMTEGNKMLLLQFVRELLERVPLEHMDTLDKHVLIGDTDALMQEKNDIITVAKMVDRVLNSVFCPSAQECLKDLYVWEGRASQSDADQLLDSILKKWMDSKSLMP